MQTIVKKWGNSLALRLPLQMAKSAHLNEGSHVDILFNGHNLVIKPESKQAILKKMLNQITSENVHGELVTDIVGAEKL